MVSNVSIRVRKFEYEKLSQMAEHFGQTKSSFIRYLINKEYNSLLSVGAIKEG